MFPLYTEDVVKPTCRKGPIVMYLNHAELMLDLYASSVNPSYCLHIEDSFDDTLQGTHREVWERLQSDNTKEEETKVKGT